MGRRFSSRLSALRAAVLVTFCLAPFLAPGPVRAEDPEYELGYVQVALAPGADVQEINAEYGTFATDSLPPLYQLHTPTGMDEETLIALLREDPRVEEAEYCYKNQTPEGSRQMVVAAVGGTIEEYLDQGAAERLHLDDAHLVTDGSGQLVAVLDTGVYAGHEALEGAIAAGGYDFVGHDADPADTANGIDDDGDGLTDEGAGHGTMIAGIVHLVAPGAQILPVRILNDEGRGKTFDVAKGIRYAVTHGAHVINLSLGLPARSGIIAHQINAAFEAGVALIAAAGNAGTDSIDYYPASDPNVLSIAALDSADVKTDFSNYGPKIGESAPGLGIRAPYYDGDWAIGAGTSFAAPFISGQCALVRSLEPALGLPDLYQRLGQGVVDIYRLRPNWPYVGELGTGRFDGLALLAHIPA
ncbi:MAG: S8 family serine peptidase, partial [Candidatus Eisenbacteria bacterium]|nr:S8 family serine peptidase [Candidatus Eisenbacteria bacterium]